MAEQAVAPTTGARMGIRSTPVALLAVAAVIFVLREGAPLFAPVLVSVLLAYALEPGVAGLMRLRLPRIVAAAVLYGMLAVGILSVAQTARAHITGFLEDLPDTLASIRQSIGESRDGAKEGGTLGRIQRAVKDLEAAVDPAAPARPPGVPRVVPVPRRFNLRDYLMSAGTQLAGIGVQLVVIAVLTFLLIAAGDLFKRKLFALTGPRLEEKKLTLEIIKTIDR